MSCCAKCDGVFSGGLIAVCNVCNDLYHASNVTKDNCSGLSDTEIKVLELKKKEPVLFYKCEGCRNNSKENPITNLLTTLNNKMDSYESLKNDFREFGANKLPMIESYNFV